MRPASYKNRVSKRKQRAVRLLWKLSGSSGKMDGCGGGTGKSGRAGKLADGRMPESG